MFAPNQTQADGAVHEVRDRGVAFPQPFVFIGNQLGICIVRWLHDKARHHAAMRQLNRLSDYCLDDMGIERPLDPRTDDLVRRLRAGG